MVFLSPYGCVLTFFLLSYIIITIIIKQLFEQASGGDGIPVELFQILKDDAEKVLHSMSTNLENSGVVTRLENVSFHSNPKEKKHQRMLKLPHNCTHLTH